MKPNFRREMLRIFLTGLLAVLPLLATFAIIAWALSLLWDFIGPSSWIGRALVSLGVGVSGSVLVGYLLGVAVVAAAIFGLGLVVEAGLQRGLARLVHRVVESIPIVRTVYDLVRRMVDLLGQSDEEGMKSMSAVWCHFGGVGGAAALALLSTREPVLIGGKPYLGVLVPTAPVPIGGGLLYVPQDWVAPADIGAEGLTSVYVSMGVTSAKYLPTAGAPVDPRATQAVPPASKDA